MNHGQLPDDLIDLGTVTRETRGGPIGYDEMERTFFLGGLGLVQD